MIDPERQGLPSIRAEPSAPITATPRQDAVPEAESISLAAPLTSIEVKSPILATEIRHLLQRFIGRREISGAELIEANAQIWALSREQGRFVRSELQKVEGSSGTETLRATVREIRVRRVKVASDGPTTADDATMAAVLAGVREFTSDGGPVDLQRMDSYLMRRGFLRDVSVRAALEPVGTDTVDLLLRVRPASGRDIGVLGQYDNSGSQSGGTDRYLAGASISNALSAGDNLDLLGLHSAHTDYLRFNYEWPWVSAATRASFKATRLQSDTSLISTRGDTYGVGLIHALRLDPKAMWTARLDYLRNHQVDSAPAGSTSRDKTIDTLRARLTANQSLQLIGDTANKTELDATLTAGNLDLSADPGVLSTDQQTAMSNGKFLKFEASARFNAGHLGPDGRFEINGSLRGQWASKNLDSAEKFVLGGPTGVRGFGSTEGTGDSGAIASVGVGYAVMPNVDVGAFYDYGHITLNQRPWDPTAVLPNNYGLSSAGLNVNAAWQSVTASATYARQLGGNPGLLNGQDSDGKTGHSRLWLTLAMRY